TGRSILQESEDYDQLSKGQEQIPGSGCRLTSAHETQDFVSRRSGWFVKKNASFVHCTDRSYFAQPIRIAECSVRTLHSRSVRCTAGSQRRMPRSYFAQPIRKTERFVRTLHNPFVKRNSPSVRCTSNL